MKEDFNFYKDIKKFNKMYTFQINEKPQLLGIERLKNFKSILLDELNEVDDIIKLYEYSEPDISEEQNFEILTHLSDWLGDIVVYVTSEATKYGIDLNKSLKIIMQSNFSKLGEDGKPLFDERGKLMKGPNYWRPEEKLKQMLKETSNKA